MLMIDMENDIEIRTKYVVLYSLNTLILLWIIIEQRNHVPFGIPLNGDHSAPGLHHVTRVF